MPDLDPLVDYIIDQVRNEQGSTHIGNTNLVKLIYLVDVLHYRRYGERVTDLPWRYYHYGPYANEVQELVERKTLPANYWTSGAFPQAFDSSVRRTVDDVINRWGLLGLNELLDYVYFETEPMENVKRGDILDFGKVLPERTEPAIKPFTQNFDPNWVQSMRQRLQDQVEAKRRNRPTLFEYDEEYFRVQRKLAEEERRPIPVSPDTELLGPIDDSGV